MNKRKTTSDTLSSFIAFDDAETVESKPKAVLLENVTNAEYHKTKRLSKSRLDVFCQSPVEYYHKFITRLMPFKESTTPMELGSICHAVLLEGADLNDIIAVIPGNCLKVNGHVNSVGTAYKQFIEDNAGKYIVKTTDVIESVLKAVEASELQDLIKESKHRERVIHWTETVNGVDVDCMMKSDFFIPLEDHVVCYDLKFSPFISDVDFNRANRRFRYWLQDAHYSAGLHRLFEKPVAFRFWIIEPTFPHRITPKSFVRHTREAASGVRLRKLEELVESQRTGIYRDRWTGEIVMNAWDFDEPMADELEITDGE